MTKKSKLSLILALVLVLTLVLAGCGCKHEWKDATCTDPKTCSLCGVTEGEKLGHTWVDATCDAPKTCSVCKTTEGSALEHQWEDATTEAPKTCKLCKKTEGDKIVTDPRFKTANCKDFIGEWSGIAKMPGKEAVGPDYTGTLDINYQVTFGPDGSYKESLSFVDKAAFIKAVETEYAAALYREFKNLYNMDEAQADQTMKTANGMDVKAYAKAQAEASAAKWEGVFSSSKVEGVYYVEDGKLYSGEKWDATLQEAKYTLTDGSLILDPVKAVFPELVFTRVAK